MSWLRWGAVSGEMPAFSRRSVRRPCWSSRRLRRRPQLDAGDVDSEDRGSAFMVAYCSQRRATARTQHDVDEAEHAGNHGHRRRPIV